MMPIYIWIPFALWIAFSISQIYKVYIGDNVNEHLYDSIPNVFTTIGVLGTFIGIFIGLQDFDTTNITESIPPLLEGLKTAFLTSIVGIILSIIFGRLSEWAWGTAESNKEEKPKDEVTALHQIIQELQNMGTNTNAHFTSLKLAIGKGDDKTISDQLLDIRTDFLNQTKNLEKNTSHLENQTAALKDISKSLGSSDDSSLLSQLKKSRVQNQDNFNTLFSNNETLKESLVSEITELKTATQEGHLGTKDAFEKNISGINETLKSNQKSLTEKFEEFSVMLSKNNTEALVEVMKATTEQFNAQMSALIEKLVQENFKELNNSVNKLNVWQQENKEMVSDLTQKFQETTENFKISSKAIEDVTTKTGEIVTNTKALTDENSQLSVLITTLKKVLIEAERFEKSTDNLLSAITKVEANINAFDKTTHKLNDWIDKEKGIKTRLDTLLVKLDEVANIKAYNGEFWEDTKKQLNEGTTIITNNTKRLNEGLNDINGEFQSQLGEILGSLDELIQRIIAKYAITA